MSFKRKLERKNEKKEQLNIKNTYGKKPKGICPRCHKHSIFMTNKENEVYCIRCNNRIK